MGYRQAYGVSWPFNICQVEVYHSGLVLKHCARPYIFKQLLEQSWEDVHPKQEREKADHRQRLEPISAAI